MRIALGIDTGGTYTDAVLIDQEANRVLAATKALTTRQDLAIGIRQAITTVLAAGAQQGLAPRDVVLVGLSTTLATNTMVEGKGGAVCLLLIGYDPELMAQYGFTRELGTGDYVYIQGGHNGMGDEAAPLDEEALRAAILSRREKVEAFAISSYFSVRNPEHELRARALVEALSGLPATCGHQLSSRLNAVRRATTAALNARLIYPLQELMLTVRRTLDEQEIGAPLMVVKGDGSLVQATWAMQRPIETILSGPAASVVGAWHLAGRQDVWVVDIGGTTTDIAALRGGWPRLSEEGARVGGWRTMVEAIDVHTAGLGGDSHVRLDGDGHMLIGPRRVLPLCMLAQEQPDTLPALRALVRTMGDGWPTTLEFIVPRRAPNGNLSESETTILDALHGRTQTLDRLAQSLRRVVSVRSRVEDLEARGLIQRAAFTPTDALHVLGRFTDFNSEAAALGAELLAAQAGMSVEALCETVVRRLAGRVSTELVSKVLEDQAGPPDWEREPSAAALLALALGASHPTDGQETASPPPDLGCQLILHRPLVAIGAPVAAYMPWVAERLHTELVIPEHAGVANAVGAVAGGVIQRRRVLINPLPGETCYRAFLPDGCRDFEQLEEAVDTIRDLMEAHVAGLARAAGAEQIDVQISRQDHWANTSGPRSNWVYLSTDLDFTATGRPSSVRR